MYAFIDIYNIVSQLE